MLIEEEKEWMLMTYYCPTYGHEGIVKPIEIKNKEINQKFSKKEKRFKNYL